MKLKSLFPVFALTASLSLFGCKEGHDHDHDHGPGHDHAEHGEPKEGEEKTPAAEGTNTAAAVMTDAKPYPLDTCIVADSKLGSMGEPVVLVHEGQEVKFCCESCQPKFDADPAKYLAKLTVDTKTEPAAK